MVLNRADRRGRHTALIVGITAFAAVLRFATLDRQSLWSDETLTALLARMGFTDMVKTVSETESTPPLYYVLLWIWTKAFGYGEIGLRSLSALAGTATVPLTYLAGSTLLGRRAGITAAVLVSVSPPLVWYSQEARSYALAVCLCAVSFAAFVRALDQPTTRALALWATASVLAVGTHYFAAFVIGAETILLLPSYRLVQVRRASAIVVGGASVLALLALEQRRNGLADFIGASSGLDERALVLAKQLLVGAALPADQAVAGVVALFFLASLALLATRATNAERHAVLVAAFVGGAAVIVPVALAIVGLDYVNTRNTLVGLVPLVIAGSAGLAVAAPRRLGALALTAVAGILLTVTAVVAIDPSYGRPDWRRFSRDVTAGGLPRVVVVTPDHQGWFARVPLQLYMPRARAIDRGLVPTLPQFARVSRRVVDNATQRRVFVREVVIGGVGWDPPSLPHGLPQSFVAVEEVEAHGYGFIRYRSPQAVSLSTADLVAPLSAILLEQRSSTSGRRR